jgi:hypothetical protein
MYNVAQFTIESSEELIKRKYYSKLAKIPYNYFKFARKAEEEKDWLDTWVEKMEDLKKSVNANLKVVDIPEGCSPNVIEDVCANRLGNYRPDLVIIDHQGLLKPDKGMSGARGRLGWDTQGEIAMALMGKARKLFNSRGTRGIAMWVLAQSAPSMLKKKAEDISVADIGLSYLIAQPAHYVIHVIRDEYMAANNEAMLKLTKVRDGRDNIVAVVKTDFNLSTFIKIEELGECVVEEATTQQVVKF